MFLRLKGSVIKVLGRSVIKQTNFWEEEKQEAALEESLTKTDPGA